MTQKILVADGKKFVLDKITGVLTNAGYEVVTCENGLEAKDLIIKEKPALVIADYLMPEKSGMGLIFDLRQAGVEVPVVITSESKFVTEENVVKSGGNGFIAKPIQDASLMAGVSKVIAGTTKMAS